MKKAEFLVLPLLAAAMILPACSGEEINQGPELRGVTDMTCMVNTAVDLLNGVAALDEEDGDITPNLKITVIPEVAVDGGYAYFTKTGEYEVCYEIEDSGGKLARTTATATVSDREVYMASPLTGGFSLETGGSVQTLADGLNGGVYSFKVRGGEIAEDIRLSRTYTMICGTEYAFKYYFNSNLAGRIKAAADGIAVAEREISAGENEVTFTHALPYKETSDGAVASETVEIELWLGALEGELELSLSRAEAQYTRPATDLKVIAENPDFNGKTEPRFDGASGTVSVTGDGKGVTLEVTAAGDAEWRGGVFVNTGIALAAGDEYEISFDIAAENENPAELCVQNKQWGPDEVISTFSDIKEGRNEYRFTGAQGTLWLRLQSGMHLNKITLSNLVLKVKESSEKSENYPVSGFGANHFDGGAGSVKVEYGKVIYTANSFGNSWGNNEISSPAFSISGAADNYVITFRAKATESVSAVFVASYADFWDTFVWKQIKITTEEQLFAINCDNKSIDGLYKFIWQFGNGANAVYRDVTVEISDIKICYKSELEG